MKGRTLRNQRFKSVSCSAGPLNALGKNTGVGSHSLLQGIFPIQGSNIGIPHCGQIPYHRSPKNAKTESRYISEAVKSRLKPTENGIDIAAWQFTSKNLHHCPGGDALMSQGHQEGQLKEQRESSLVFLLL